MPDHALPQSLSEWIDHALENAQVAFDRMMGGGTVDERMHDINTFCDRWIAAYALLALDRLAVDDREPVGRAALAERFAGDLSNALDDGGAMGEWLYQWRTERAAGKPATLPFVLVAEADDGGPW